MRLNPVEIVIDGNKSVLGIYESKGLTYAVRWAAFYPLSEAEVRRTWREDRLAFRAFDTSTMSFV